MLNTVPQATYSPSFYEHKPSTTSNKGVFFHALYRIHWLINFLIKWNIKGTPNNTYIIFIEGPQKYIQTFFQMPKNTYILTKEPFGCFKQVVESVQNLEKLKKTPEKEKEKYSLVFEGFQKTLP
jgi:hypothetical protein